MGQTDRCIRAMTNDGSFRVITIRSTDTVQGILDAQEVSSEHAAMVGDLVTASVLVREMMSPGMRVQAILSTSPYRFNVVADSHPGGLTRGLVNVSEGAVVELGEGVVLQVVRVLYNGELHQGFIGTDPQGGLSGALMAYMERSEQITSIAMLSCVVEGEREVRAAGGAIIQLLPGAEEGAVALMAARAGTFEDITPGLLATDGDPEALLAQIMEHFDYSLLGVNPVFNGCNCDQARVLGALASMGREELEQIVSSGEVLSINCDYCARNYSIGAEQIRPLLDSN